MDAETRMVNALDAMRETVHNLGNIDEGSKAQAEAILAMGSVVGELVAAAVARLDE